MSLLQPQTVRCALPLLLPTLRVPWLSQRLFLERLGPLRLPVHARLQLAADAAVSSMESAGKDDVKEVSEAVCLVTDEVNGTMLPFPLDETLYLAERPYKI